MHHAERDGKQQLGHEVAVGDRVERVGGHAVEAELTGSRLAVQRVPGTGERPGTERRDVRAAAAVGQPAAVALEHLDVRQQVMGEEDRLGRLDVRHPRQDRVALPLREAHQRALHARGPRRRARRSSGAPRAAGPWPPGRCESAPCGASRPPARYARRVRPPGSCGRPRGPGPRPASPASTSIRSASSPATSAATSASSSRPARPSPRTWATEPARSSSASARSTSTERVKSAVRGSVSPANRPPQSRMPVSPIPASVPSLVVMLRDRLRGHAPRPLSGRRPGTGSLPPP